MANQYVIIVAGGVGKRMQTELPKQFVQVCGKEIILHTIMRFLNFNPSLQIIISVHPDYYELLKTLLAKHQYGSIKIVHGGPTRFHSVKNALDTINDLNTVVGIHDAARPFVSIDTISRCFNVAQQKGNAIPSIALHESIREADDKGNKAVNRDRFRIIQTPQCFRVSDIKKAFELKFQESFTDDASVLEAAGGTINLVEGNEENIKITLPKDLLIAKTFIENEQRRNM